MPNELKNFMYHVQEQKKSYILQDLNLIIGDIRKKNLFFK